MNVERFLHLLDVHGAEVLRWPPAERDEAALLVKTSEVARQALSQAQRLDTALLDEGFEPPTAQLLRQVAEVPLRHPRRLARLPWWPFKPVYAPTLALVAAVSFGLFVGHWAFPANGSAEVTSELSEDDVEELVELAFANSVDLGSDLLPSNPENVP